MSEEKGEHQANVHKVVTARQAVGKPHWRWTINLKDVFHNDDLMFIDVRDEVVRRIRASSWYATYNVGDELFELIDELSDAEDVKEFDMIWDNIYDVADYDRVWIVTR